MATLQPVKKATASASTPCHDHALELCIPYISDTTTLLRVSLANHEQQAQAALYLQQQLPSVVQQMVYAAVRRLNRPDADENQQLASRYHVLESLGWVLSTAGPAVVGTAAVAETLLRLSTHIPMLLDSYQLPNLALKHGLQPTMQLVVGLSQQRVKFLHVWFGAVGARQRLMLLQPQQQGPQQQDQNQKDDVSSSFSFPRHFNWLCFALDDLFDQLPINQLVSSIHCPFFCCSAAASTLTTCSHRLQSHATDNLAEASQGAMSVALQCLVQLSTALS
jgi:hypothetical protein